MIAARGKHFFCFFLSLRMSDESKKKTNVRAGENSWDVWKTSKTDRRQERCARGAERLPDGDENEHLCDERWLHVCNPPSAGGGGRGTVPWVFPEPRCFPLSAATCMFEAFLSFFFFFLGWLKLAYGTRVYGRCFESLASSALVWDCFHQAFRRAERLRRFYL